MMTRAERYLQLATTIAGWSKDPSTRVGCVIVGPHNEIRSVGYNGFPRSVRDGPTDNAERYVGELKYLWTEHAERNAIYNAARMGTALDGCALYCTHHPCAACARAVIQSGILLVVVPTSLDPTSRWFADWLVAREMLSEARVELAYL